MFICFHPNIWINNFAKPLHPYLYLIWKFLEANIYILLVHVCLSCVCVVMNGKLKIPIVVYYYYKVDNYGE
jgi:hypothetical protein